MLHVACSAMFPHPCSRRVPAVFPLPCTLHSLAPTWRSFPSGVILLISKNLLAAAPWCLTRKRTRTLGIKHSEMTIVNDRKWNTLPNMAAARLDRFNRKKRQQMSDLWSRDLLAAKKYVWIYFDIKIWIYLSTYLHIYLSNIYIYIYIYLGYI